MIYALMKKPLQKMQFRDYILDPKVELGQLFLLHLIQHLLPCLYRVFNP